MEQQDDWLEGVRRWYFGGEAPEGTERDEQIVWPASASSPAAHAASTIGMALPAPVPAVPLVRSLPRASGTLPGTAPAERACREACLR